MDIVYSIIIPHKNIPDLLQRCLDSIPLRDDVQVIVVDDNSDPNLVDFKSFPRWSGNYEYYLTKEGRGAGYARNMGLSHAVGKWLLFADADDFFTGDIGELLDEMKDAKEDLIFFDHRSVLSDNPAIPVVRAQYASDMIMNYLDGNPFEGDLRCYVLIPVCKIIRKTLVDQYQIRFDETKWANDAWFSAQVGCYAKRIAVSGIVGYVMTTRTGSLVSDFCGSSEEVLVRLKENLKSDRLFNKFGLSATEKISKRDMRITYDKHGFRWCFWFCLKNVFHWRVSSSFFCYIVVRKYNRIVEKR